MVFDAFVLMAALAASSQNIQQTPAPVAPATNTAVATDQRGGQQGEQRQRPTGDRPHTVGLGGQLAISNRGVGAGTRLWFGDRVGVNLNAFWYSNNNRYTTAGTDRGSTYGAFPSFILMLTQPDGTRDVDIRPYIGGGISYISTSQRIVSNGIAENQRIGGVGSQVFGGVEMTFREADWMTISAEGIYYRLPVRFVNSSVVDGFNYLLAFHFYLK